MMAIVRLLYKYDLVRKARRLRCLLTGHEINYGSRWEQTPDVCARCWYNRYEIDLYELTLPELLHYAYVWLVEQDWDWFFRFDMWMQRRFHARLPSWWEY